MTPIKEGESVDSPCASMGPSSGGWTFDEPMLSSWLSTAFGVE
jgi:hypothetical protein